MKRASLLVAAALTIGGASTLGADASAGGVLKTMGPEFLSQSMGLRLIVLVPVRGGPKTFEAQVVDAERFASRGFPDAKLNDHVTIVELGPKRGMVKHDKSGKGHNFKVKDDGAIERE